MSIPRCLCCQGHLLAERQLDGARLIERTVLTCILCGREAPSAAPAPVDGLRAACTDARDSQGRRKPPSKLNAAQVVAIRDRAEAGVPRRRLAGLYAVSLAVVDRVVAGSYVVIERSERSS